MHPLLSPIKSVGFDLDRTLYQETPEMTDRITENIAIEMLGLRPELENIQNTRRVCEKKFQELRSWPQVLKKMGVPNPEEIVNRCLGLAEVIDLISKDEELVWILELLHQKFFLFMITGSPQKASLAKLRKIGINPKLFSFLLFGDSPHFFSKNGPESFLYFLSQSPYPPPEHVYIGDNLKSDIIVPKSLGIKTIMVGKLSEAADFSVIRIHDIEKLLLPETPATK